MFFENVDASYGMIPLNVKINVALRKPLNVKINVALRKHICQKIGSKRVKMMF